MVPKAASGGLAPCASDRKILASNSAQDFRSSTSFLWGKEKKHSARPRAFHCHKIMSPFFVGLVAKAVPRMAEMGVADELHHTPDSAWPH